MNEVDLRIEVAGHISRPIAGADTTILVVPEQFYVEVDGQGRALAAQVLAKFLRKLANKQAADLGEELHHAEFVVTTDPEVMAELGSIHDCSECIEGVQRALAFMAENPGTEMLVGALYWAAPL